MISLNILYLVVTGIYQLAVPRSCLHFTFKLKKINLCNFMHIQKKEETQDAPSSFCDALRHIIK